MFEKHTHTHSLTCFLQQQQQYILHIKEKTYINIKKKTKEQIRFLFPLHLVHGISFIF